MVGFSYREVGATAGELPPGYHHLRARRPIGTGRRPFERAAARLLAWEVHRGAGILVPADRTQVVPGADVVLTYRFGGRWPITAPVRIVEVIAEPDRAGFVYGTLPGHPECGEERFLVVHDQDDAVYAEIAAFSRPGRWFTRLAGPVGTWLQHRATQSYLDALAEAARTESRDGSA